MTKITKFAAVALAALTLTAGVAQAGPKKWGPGVGIGIGLGILTTAIIAEAAYANSGRRCEIVDQVNAYGDYVGSRKVCYGY